MAEEEKEDHHHERHLFRRDKKEETPEKLEEKIKHHSHLKHVGESVAVSAGAYALHEKLKAKTDPEHARRHKMGEKAALTVAATATKIVLHEHHKEKGTKHDLKQEEKKTNTQNHFPFFGSHDK